MKRSGHQWIATAAFALTGIGTLQAEGPRFASLPLTPAHHEYAACPEPCPPVPCPAPRPTKIIVEQCEPEVVFVDSAPREPVRPPVPCEKEKKSLFNFSKVRVKNCYYGGAGPVPAGESAAGTVVTNVPAMAFATVPVMLQQTTYQRQTAMGTVRGGAREAGFLSESAVREIARETAREMARESAAARTEAALETETGRSQEIDQIRSELRDLSERVDRLESALEKLCTNLGRR